VRRSDRGSVWRLTQQDEASWGDPTFRVSGKIFAMHKVDDGRPSVWCKSEPFERDAWVEHDRDWHRTLPCTLGAARPAARIGNDR
jgi:hypothetical protein